MSKLGVPSSPSTKSITRRIIDSYHAKSEEEKSMDELDDMFTTKTQAQAKEEDNVANAVMKLIGREGNEFYDVWFNVRGEIFPAHRLILGTCLCVAWESLWTRNNDPNNPLAQACGRRCCGP